MKKRLALLAELAVNFFLPWLVYTLTVTQHGEFYALMASSIPPLLWSLAELAWHRRLDALSGFVLFGIVLSAGAMLLGGDARLLLVRESLGSGLIGIIFLVSLLFPQPLLFYLARATVIRHNGGLGAENFLAWWQDGRSRRTIRIVTAVWGIGLTGEALLRTWLAWHWQPQRFLAIAPILGYCIAGVICGWTFWFLRSRRQAVADRSIPGAR